MFKSCDKLVPKRVKKMVEQSEEKAGQQQLLDQKLDCPFKGGIVGKYVRFITIVSEMLSFLC